MAKNNQNRTPRDSDSEIKISKINQKELEQIPIDNKECEAVIDQVSEHLACFTILGFDYVGNPVSISVVKSALQDMALLSLVSKFLERALAPTEDSMQEED